MTSVADHEGDLAQALDRLARGTKFAELFAESGAGQEVRLDSKSTTVTVEPRLRGFVFRAWTGSHWTEAAASEFAPRSIREAAERIEREASRTHGSAAPPGESATTRGSWTAKGKRSLRELGPEGTVALGKELLGYALGSPEIKEAQVALAWEETDRLYLNSAGARCLQQLERTRAVVVPMAIENGRAVADYWSQGGIGGLERAPDLGEATVRRTAASTRALLAAKAPPAGVTDVLLDPGVSGTFAHESFGHGTEADQFVRDRSYLKPILGQVVAPEFLTVVDDGTVPGGWGSGFCDDEGNPSHRTLLIDRGRFVGALHDRETAAILGAKPTGNTRRSNFMSRAFVRMTNTYVVPGDRTVDELIGDVKDGVLLERWMSGIEDPLGGQMQIKVRKGHRIEHGKVTDLVGPMALSGKVLDFLRAIRGVAQEPATEMEPGYCGKGHSDYLPVGSGGVHLLSRAIVGPA